MEQACAAAIANLDVFEEEGTLAAIQPKILLLASKLERFREIGHVGDVRQRGMIAGIELVADRKSKKSFPEKERIGHKVCLAAREKGVLLRPLGDVIVLMPPLSIRDGELERLVAAIRHGIVKVTGSA